MPPSLGLGQGRRQRQGLPDLPRPRERQEGHQAVQFSPRRSVRSPPRTCPSTPSTRRSPRSELRRITTRTSQNTDKRRRIPNATTLHYSREVLKGIEGEVDDVAQKDSSLLATHGLTIDVAVVTGVALATRYPGSHLFTVPGRAEAQGIGMGRRREEQPSHPRSVNARFERGSRGESEGDGGGERRDAPQQFLNESTKAEGLNHLQIRPHAALPSAERAVEYRGDRRPLLLRGRWRRRLSLSHHLTTLPGPRSSIRSFRRSSRARLEFF